MTSRRTDHKLRKAISVIERMLLIKPDSATVMKRSLDQVMQLLGASFGYVYQCYSTNERDDDRVPWDFVACLSKDETCSPPIYKELPNSCTSSAVPDPYLARFLVGRCIYGDAPERDLQPIPHFHPEIFNFICIPILDARSVHAVMYICNLPTPLSEDIALRLRPFIAACSCLLRSAEKNRPGIQLDSGIISLKQYEPVLDQMFNGVLLVGDDERIIFANKAVACMLGVAANDIQGMDLGGVLPNSAPSWFNRLGSEQKSVGQTPEDINSENILQGIAAQGAGGKKLLVNVRLFQLKDRGNIIRGLFIDDISERLKSLKDYRATLQRFQVLTTLAPVGILQLNQDWECIYVNDTWCEYAQMTPDEAKASGWLTSLYYADANMVLENLRQELSISARFDMEFRLQTPLGRIVWVKANACSLYRESGEVSGVIMTFTDITAHLNNAKRLQDIAERDQLTGLINRGFFNDRLDVALRGVPRFGPVGLMYLDLDNFKQINDTLGHDSGDSLLCQVADRLRDCLRKSDTVARIGGDEFTVILTHVDHMHAVAGIADKIIEALLDPFDLNGRSVYVSCSIGIAVAENAVTSMKQLLKQADVALYKAKESGKNQYHFYSPELEKDAGIHIHLRQSLKEVSRNDFRLVFQPLIDARTNSVMGVEALTRWEHEEVGKVGPDVFIPMVEDSGLIDDFADWLFNAALQQLAYWVSAGIFPPQAKLAINLSPRQFRNPLLVQQLCELIHHYSLSPELICLEVTETAMIDDHTAAAKALNELKGHGFEIALDDFGTGYSSLSYLRTMPLQSIKIDRAFTQDLADDKENTKIVRGLIALAKNLELKVIAEGVEEEQASEWLLQHGCYAQQGFYFYRPLEAPEMENLLQKMSF